MLGARLEPGYCRFLSSRSLTVEPASLVNVTVAPFFGGPPPASPLRKIEPHKSFETRSSTLATEHGYLTLGSFLLKAVFEPARLVKAGSI